MAAAAGFAAAGPPTAALGQSPSAALPSEAPDLEAYQALPSGDRPYGTPVPGGVLIGADISIQLKVMVLWPTIMARHQTACFAYRSSHQACLAAGCWYNCSSLS